MNGGYAEFVATDAATVARMPEEVRFDEAAIAACAIGTMLHAIRAIGRVQLGERVLVTGAGGGLGIHGVQLAKAAGAFVVGQTTSPAKADAIRRAGADVVAVEPRGSDFSAAVLDATGGEGADLVLDTVGTALFSPTRKSLAKGGRWVIIGQLTGDFVPFNPAQLFLRGISLLSATSTTRQELADVLDLVGRRVIRPIVDRTMPLAGAAAAHQAVEGSRVVGRIVLRPAA